MEGSVAVPLVEEKAAASEEEAEAASAASVTLEQDYLSVVVVATYLQLPEEE